MQQSQGSQLDAGSRVQSLRCSICFLQAHATLQIIRVSIGIPEIDSYALKAVRATFVMTAASFVDVCLEMDTQLNQWYHALGMTIALVQIHVLLHKATTPVKHSPFCQHSGYRRATVM